ncbi:MULTISPECIES: cbb3-type cytochrome oxidase assembly protein CcoS [unclassified Ectothiorhodospira]|uniref:cbb3-type cytochrome oxidase assembly protein CcoS n=1 Tax=unclassified Ectothiorhodospira TaxID=2684909 RepID=UPI001EE877CF|nr:MULTISPECIES: cbb3-type cytochrome oxidase assembly protein CcoS [unclassified Ectothiorhodospira]MCG5515607.1 cbb3-type cytochrome oxidase assembly protein CcoS [Ectothiorhodospira sp. 9100]MCG5518869.1 cbb3-type cytochrome oxidase assembly protein CcoS [Ectothiorhodospira sp. 9905]
MNILYLLIPLGIIFMAVILAAFLWTVRAGQYDDMEGPAHRILMDDDDPRIPHRDPVSREPREEDKR